MEWKRMGESVERNENIITLLELNFDDTERLHRKSERERERKEKRER
jgi:hypothetical protein